MYSTENYIVKSKIVNTQTGSNLKVWLHSKYKDKTINANIVYAWKE